MTRVLPRLIPCLVAFFFLSMSAYAQNHEIPFRFEENRGQEATSAKYIGWADGYVAEMYSNEVVFRGMGQPVHMTFEGAEKNFEQRATDPMKATTDVYNPR